MNRHFMLFLISILRDGSSRRSWATKYLSYALSLEFDGLGLEVLLKIWEYYLNSEYYELDFGGADNMASCLKNIVSSGKSLNDFLSPYHLAANRAAPFLTM